MICVASAQIRSQFEVDTSHGFHEKLHSTQNNKGFSKRSVPSWHSGTGTCPCFVVVVSFFQLTMVSLRQGTQHFTDENKVSRK